MALFFAIGFCACGNKSSENLTLIRHYGQEKYDELKYECNDQEQLEIANGIVEQAKKIMEFVGNEKDVDSEANTGALSRYYYFNSQVNTANVSVKLITTRQQESDGYIWVEYSAKYYDNTGKVIYGAEQITSRWEIKKENNEWIVTDIDEIK